MEFTPQTLALGSQTRNINYTRRPYCEKFLILRNVKKFRQQRLDGPKPHLANVDVTPRNIKLTTKLRYFQKITTQSS
ncbi:hypothetical protein BdWA1_000863 [Babesia duncani]|uniref:Uncharacterized protein n=1 Tax=Babesia duncani TaxID=323732 RepID=A0AAD9UQG5_9APIC|nr:hypothetical protein BdWA1_000863 [Babesia duncani]